MSPIRRGVVVVLGMALAVTVAACSSSKHTPSAGGTQAHLQKKASAAAAAVVAGKYDALYAYLDADCQKRWTKQTWAANSAAAVALLKSQGVDLSQDHVGSVTVTSFTPTSAQVTVHYLTKSGQDASSATATTDKSVTWVHQDGQWVTSDCPTAPPSTGSTSSLLPFTSPTSG